MLVSACLLGRRCRYDGGDNRDTVLERELAEKGERAVPFCPEEVGGLDTPRPPAWLTRAAAEVVEGKGSIVTDAGRDVTAEFLAGAREARATCAAHGIQRAYLKERSPSCGVRWTHVGNERVDGPGVTAELLARAGVETVGVEGRRREPDAAEAPERGAGAPDDDRAR